jgi:hypothetical protein
MSVHYRRRLRGVAAAWLACPAALMAQTVPPATNAASPPPPVVATPAATTVVATALTLPATAHLPLKTPVDIEIAEQIGSKISHIGDTFALRLAEPMVVDGKVVLPAGIPGRGEVIHVAKGGWGGKAGELIVAARYLECGDLHIPLGHFHFGKAGEDRAETALGVGMVVPLASFLIAGGEVVVSPGARANAKVTADVDVSAEAMAACIRAAK